MPRFIASSFKVVSLENEIVMVRSVQFWALQNGSSLRCKTGKSCKKADFHSVRNLYTAFLLIPGLYINPLSISTSTTLTAYGKPTLRLYLQDLFGSFDLNVSGIDDAHTSNLFG